MKKIVRRIGERESMIALSSYSTCACQCGCAGNCTCPGAPTHQIGIGVREQGKDSSASNSRGRSAVSVH